MRQIRPLRGVLVPILISKKGYQLLRLPAAKFAAGSLNVLLATPPAATPLLLGLGDRECDPNISVDELIGIGIVAHVDCQHFCSNLVTMVG